MKLLSLNIIKQRLVSWSIIFALGIFFTCTALPLRAASDSTATLIIYRSADFRGASFKLLVNGAVLVKKFETQSIHTLRLSPGYTVLETDGGIYVENKKFSIEIRAGETYFIEVLSAYDIFYQAYYLIKRTEEQAHPILERIRRKRQRR